jgi:DNA-binding transcriptional ArsR family regulator
MQSFSRSMGSPFPLRNPVASSAEETPRLVDLDDDVADEVFEALSAATARELLATCYEEPATASELAEEVDTSLQNARYHLDTLLEAGLVEVVDTWYSERGTEMKVYAPANESLVLFASNDGSALRDLIGRVLGATVLLGVVSLLVETLLGGSDDAAYQSGGSRGVGIASEGADAATSTPVADAAGPGGLLGLAQHPGLVFFLGGALVLALLVAWTVWRG